MRITTFAEVIIAVATVAAMPISVDADVLFSQAPVDNTSSRISDWSNENQKADDFTLSNGPVIITRIDWWGSYGANPDPAVDNFVFKFFSEDPGNPGYPEIWCLDDGTRYPSSVVGNFTRSATTFVSKTSGTHDGGTVYRYSAVLDRPIHLTGGTRYWLAITNSTPTYAYPPVANSKWGWLCSSTGSQWYRMGHCPLCADDWTQSDTNNLSFELYTFPKVGLSNKAASDRIISAASTKFLFTLWGKVKITGADAFTIDDGSGSPVSVNAPGFAGFRDGDYVRATGLINYPSAGPFLETDADDVVKIE